MYVNSIKNYSSQNYKPAFKSDIIFDIGGSQREGSCKIYYSTSETNEELFRDNTTVNQLGKKTFQDSSDFTNLLIDKIGKIQRAARKSVKEMGYDKDENAIKNVTIFLPSYTSNNFAFYLPNHRDKDSKPLKDLDFRTFRQRLIENGVEVAPNMKIKVCQDAMGTGLAMSKKLYDLGMLKEGKYYTACITGGGCGIANIEMPDSEKVIVKSSGSSYLSQSLSLQKVSRAGASAPAVIDNFCRAMGMNDELIEEIKSCHKAEFTMQETCVLPKNVKTRKLRDLLVESGKFEIKKEDDDSITMKVKDAYKGKFNIARRNAIDKYCLALARLAIIKKNEGSNGMIVTGKLAHAIDNVGKSVYKQGVADWTMQHLSQSFNSYELDKLQATYHFEVMCDDRFFIDDNTECKELAHLSEFVDPIRGNWLKLDVKHLKDSNDSVD